MTLAQAIFAILSTFSPHSDDVGEPLRFERLHAAAVDVAAVSDLDTAAAAIVLMRHESALARYVAEGCERVPKGSPNCDNGRARWYTQLWRPACPNGWALPVASREAQQAFARCTVNLWRGAWYRCRASYKDPIEGAFAGYRSMCRYWAPAEARAREWRVVRGRLAAMVTE